MNRGLFFIISVFVAILVLAGGAGIGVGISSAVGGGSSAPGHVSHPGKNSAPGHVSAPHGIGGSGGGSGNNLVDNSSFEQGLKGWEFVQASGTNLSGVDETTAHTGKRSFQVTTNITCDVFSGDWWYIQGANVIPVAPGATYDLSVWYRKSEGFGFGVSFYYGSGTLAQPARQSPGVELRALPGKSAEVIAQNGASAIGVLPHHGPPADGDWDQVGFSFPAYPGVTAVRVSVGDGTGCGAPRTTHYDDVAVTLVK
jgi:hypothetical protein